MSNVTLGLLQNRLKDLADHIAEQEKTTRQNILIEMTSIAQQLSEQQQIEVIKVINIPSALRYLSASGIRGDARIALYARITMLEKEMK